LLSEQTEKSVEVEMVEGLASELRAGYDQSQRMMTGMIDELGLAAERCLRELERVEGLVASESGKPPEDGAEPSAQPLSPPDAAAATAAAESRARIAALEQDLLQSQEQLEGLQHARNVLAGEVADLRQRLGEMSAMLTQKERLLAQQQQAWSDEIRPLQQILEALNARLMEPVDGPRSAAPPVAAASGVFVETPAGPALVPDPVLEAVIAQFKLKQDGVRRRTPVESSAAR